MKTLALFLLSAIIVFEAWLLQRRLAHPAGAQPSREESAGDAVGRGVKGSSTAGHKIAALKEENARLQQHLYELASASLSPDRSAGSVEETEAEQRLLETLGARKLSETPVPHHRAADGSLNPAFAAFFGLNERETTRLSHVLIEASRWEKQLVAANTSIRTLDENSVELALSPYPEEGGKIYDRLVHEFREVLGEERYESFLALSGGGGAPPFGSLGVQQRTLTVTWDESAKHYRVHENVRVGETAWSNISTVKTVAQIQSISPQLAPLLPAHMRDGKGADER